MPQTQMIAVEKFRYGNRMILEGEAFRAEDRDVPILTSRRRARIFTEPPPSPEPDPPKRTTYRRRDLKAEE